MQQLTPEGQQKIDELARQYQVSVDAAMSMLRAVVEGNGTMAQFNHPEFGGSGQWMQGGMTMVSDMFNHGLKSQVDGLCGALSALLASSSQFLQPTPSQQQSVGTAPSASELTGAVSLFVPAESGAARHWWPDALGAPSSSGAQNQVRYAYFAPTRRLAIEVQGELTVYDTLDHHISGFSQQQSGSSSLSFSSQHGLIDVAQLPVVSPGGEAKRAAVAETPSPTPASDPDPLLASEPSEVRANRPQPIAQDVDIFAAIEKLGALKEKGLLTEEEFTNKKTELLHRL